MKNPGAAMRRAFVVDEPGGSVVVERLARLVLEPADGVLNLAGALLRRAFGVGLGVARHLAGDFLHLAFGLLDRTFDAILVHRSCPLLLSWESQGQRTGSRRGSALQHVVNRKAACQTTHAKETRPAPVMARSAFDRRTGYFWPVVFAALLVFAAQVPFMPLALASQSLSDAKVQFFGPSFVDMQNWPAPAMPGLAACVPCGVWALANDMPAMSAAVAARVVRVFI